MGHPKPSGKENAMSPTLNREMIDVLETLELDQDARVLVLTVL